MHEQKSAVAVAPVAPATAVQPTEHAGHGDAKAPTTPAKAKAPREEPRAPIEVTAEQQMRIGLATTAAVSEGVRHSIRAVGSVVADQRREAQVHTRVEVFVSFVNRFAVVLVLVLPVSVAAACTAPAEGRPLPPNDLPLVEGLVPAEDEDPRIDAVR